VMAKYQPGGAAEKQQLLSFLVSPDTVIVPDPSLQLKGLERLTPTLSDTAEEAILTEAADKGGAKQTVAKADEVAGKGGK
ncbi:GIP, partial [Symbiodinium necroappetens]